VSAEGEALKEARKAYGILSRRNARPARHDLARRARTVAGDACHLHTVGTLGAGDVFHGAFGLAITEGEELRQALRFASAGGRAEMHPLRWHLCRPATC
jgi:sugar/nucleoside kinase (ribokinase family)